MIPPPPPVVDTPAGYLLLTLLVVGMSAGLVWFIGEIIDEPSWFGRAGLLAGACLVGVTVLCIFMLGGHAAGLW